MTFISTQCLDAYFGNHSTSRSDVLATIDSADGLGSSKPELGSLEPFSRFQITSGLRLFPRFVLAGYEADHTQLLLRALGSASG